MHILDLCNTLLKPFCLIGIELRNLKLLEALKGRTLFLVIICFVNCKLAIGFPSICSVINSPQFRSCLGLKVSTTVCGYPPRPCAHFSYNIPQYFTEVVSHPGETFFVGLPGVNSQLGSISNRLPFGSEDDNGSFAFHAHAIAVPYSSIALSSLPCGGQMTEITCFSAMTEHLGQNWHTGSPDLWQPQFMTWSAAPKACLIKGAVTSATGVGYPTGYPNYPSCSINRSWLTKYPPSNQPVCNGWGIMFPRYGVVTNADQLTASLVIASRIRSLGSEVFQSIPTSKEESMQMIYPQKSGCFRGGQNIGFLRTQNLNEISRITKVKKKNYIYVTWKKVSCRRDIPAIWSTNAAVNVLESVCRGLE